MKNISKTQKPKPYRIPNPEGQPCSMAQEPVAAYTVIPNDRGPYATISMVKQGVEFPYFMQVAQHSALSLNDWADILNISGRTMQRYEQENKTFSPIYAEKIVAIDMLMRYGADVFGSANSFHAWLEVRNLALGGVYPKTLLDTSFGIELIKSELLGIEHGVLA
ncbi:MAG: MbcA/ParS/Xre antitoxin family protein [Prevotellaceae bacterium]|jgi:putative toxin-antitoxin system antitoxin component (TIGR02293 family)|nr:MbcA/ParS/Xre antitoxin family protein [Prevotellaceae bacterium]